MYNKKVLREATKSLDRTVAPAKKKDVIVDQEGQRKYPGQVTKIMGDTMATDGYGYIPLMVYPNNGQAPQLINPNTGQYRFPGATEFTEVPVTRANGGDISIPDLNQYEDGGEYDLTDDEIRELKKGGYVVHELPSMPKKKNSKRYSRSLMATNQLFAQNPLLKKQKSKKRKIFNPDSKYYAEGGFHDDLGKHRQLIRDWTYGADIGMLQKAQEGEEINIPNKELPETKVAAQMADVYRFEKEFEKNNSWDKFRDERKKKYIRRTSPGLNKLFGVSEKNFPDQAFDRIKNAYEEKKSNYVIEKMFKASGLNPNKREDWADAYTEAIENPKLTGNQRREIQHLLNSKYSSKLQPSTWSKFLSGLQQTANIALPKKYELDLDIPGYTKGEEKAAKESFWEPLNVITEPTNFIGAAVYNELSKQNEIAGTEAGYTPSLGSGEILGQAPAGSAGLLNPLSYAGALPNKTLLSAVGELKPISAAMKTAPIAVKALSNIPKLGKAASYLEKPAELSANYSKFMPSINQMMNLDMIKEGVLKVPETLEKGIDYAYGANGVTGEDLAMQTADNLFDFIGAKSAYQWSKPFARKLAQALDKPLTGFTTANIKNQAIKTFVPGYQAPLSDNMNYAWQGNKLIGKENLGATLGEILRKNTAAKGVLGLTASWKAYNDTIKDYSNAETAEERSEAAKKIMSQGASDLTNLLATTATVAPNTLLGKKSLDAYNSTLATAYYAADNANKLRKQDAEGIRIANNIARLVQALGTRKDGGDIWEDDIDDETRKQLEALGYIIEDLD